MISRKIAIANQPVADRPDEMGLAEQLMGHLKPILLDWLSLEELDLDCLSAEWSLPSADILSDRLIACRGKKPSLRAAICANEALSDKAVTTLLRLPGDTDPASLSALRPFAMQNLVALGGRINASQIMRRVDNNAEWAVEEIPTLLDTFEPYDTLSVTVALKGLGPQDYQLTLLMTRDLLISDAERATPKVSSDAPTLPPRLGPCHVEVRAVGDRVSLSVADCTRLEIGQIVALPGLRFDHLDLDVEMGDGPVRLTDASLGADKGRKAVRLNRGLDPAFRERPISPASNPADGVPK